MLVVLLPMLALAAEPVFPSAVTAAPIDLVRVEDPAYPGAIARSSDGALLVAPPTDGTPWRWETVAVPDGFPGDVNVASIGAEAWHEAGFRGQGVKVAIFDLQWQGALDDPATLGEVTTADCFSHPSCEVPIDLEAPRYGFDLGSHGVACAQTVRSIAPDAEISLVRVNAFTTFQNAAAWAIRHDIDVISMSLSFFNESFYDGGGPFEPVVRSLAAAGVLLVVSSGNYAGQHWTGRWIDADHDDVLDFGGEGFLRVRFGSAGRKTIYLNWDEHAACGRSDLDALVFAPSGDIVGRGSDRQSSDAGHCSPVERIGVEVETPGEYRLQVIGRRVDPTFLALDVLTLGGSVVDSVARDSMTDPGSSPWALTVGAVQADGYATNDVEGFSSQGPGRAGVPKPELAGPDGVTTDVYGPRGFFGTSAAAPAVAAAAALVLSREPELSAREVSDRLKLWALRDRADWSDPRWGAGKVRLPDPVSAPASGCGGSNASMLLPLIVVARRRRRRARAHRRSCSPPPVPRSVWHDPAARS